MTKPLRWGILGTGNIAGQFMGGLAGARRCVVTAVASRSIESARAFAARYPAASLRTHATYEALLSDNQVDAIYISAPNSMHHEWTIRALRAGKHVLCEKPLALRESQGREMFDEARRAGRLLVEAFMYRSHPQTRLVMEKLRSGAIGQVKLVRTNFCFRTTKIKDNIRFSKALGGGALMDVGCYCVSLSRLAAGDEPVEVQATAIMHESGVDEMTSGVLRFANGVVATFSCGMGVQADNAAMICGTEGYIILPVPWKPPPDRAEIVIGRAVPPRQDAPPPGAPGAPGTGSGAPQAPRPAWIPAPRDSIFVETDQPLYAMEADDFAAAALDGAAPAVSEQDSLGNLRVMDQIRERIGLKWG